LFVDLQDCSKNINRRSEISFGALDMTPNNNYCDVINILYGIVDFQCFVFVVWLWDRQSTCM